MPVLNEAEFIAQSLGTVLAQDYPADRLEILVVDGGSTDTTRAIVQQLMADHPHLRLLDNPGRIQAAALNIGIRAAAGEIVVRVDGHTLVASDYVRRCVELLVEGRADNVGGMMRGQGKTVVGQAVAVATQSPFGIGGSKFHYTSQEQFVDTVYLGAYRRQTLLDLGLYDETLPINEDYELNYRLRQAGGKILLSPHIRSVYVPRASLAALWRQYFRYGRWKVRTLQKHPASLQWRQTVAPLFVAVLILSGLVSLLWPPALAVLVITGAVYLLANLLASTIAAGRAGWRYLPILPIIFASIHLAWGLGFWTGLLRAVGSRN